MADSPIPTSRLTAEGRATIPAAVRRVLEVGPGERLAFLIEGDEVRLISARRLAEQVWANNHGGDAGDSVRDVRAAREADRISGDHVFGPGPGQVGGEVRVELAPAPHADETDETHQADEAGEAVAARALLEQLGLRS